MRGRECRFASGGGKAKPFMGHEFLRLGVKVAAVSVNFQAMPSISPCVHRQSAEGECSPG
jgi:hypothetical protein